MGGVADAGRRQDTDQWRQDCGCRRTGEKGARRAGDVLRNTRGCGSTDTRGACMGGRLPGRETTFPLGGICTARVEQDRSRLVADRAVWKVVGGREGKL